MKKEKFQTDAVQIKATVPDIPEDANTVISFKTPYAIPIPDGVYKIKWNDTIVELLVRRLQKRAVGSMVLSDGQFAQLPFDKYGQSAISEIRIKIPYKIDTSELGKSSLLFGKDETIFSDKKIALNILNKLIEKVRYTTDEFWIEPIRYQDFSQYDVTYYVGKKRYLTKKMLIDTGKGPLNIVTENPFNMEDEKRQELIKVLESDIEYDISKIFLLNAKDACVLEDYRLALIESVIALEITLSNFIRERGRVLGISKDRLEEFIVRVGLTGNFTVVLKMLLPGVKLPEDEIYEECTGAITIRNKIIHEGRREVHQVEAEKKIIAIEKMINFIKGV